jgi:hypothetical protein
MRTPEFAAVPSESSILSGPAAEPVLGRCLSGKPNNGLMQGPAPLIASMLALQGLVLIFNERKLLENLVIQYLGPQYLGLTKTLELRQNFWEVQKNK